LARSHARLPQQLPELVQRDLLRLAEHAPDILKFLEGTKADSPSVSTRKFSRPLAERLGLSVRDADRLLFAFQNLQQIDQETDREKTFEIVADRLASDGREKWLAQRTVILSIFALLDEDHPAVISIKAARLSHSYERIFVNAEIITDIRPVFTSKGDKILNMVVQHKLVVTEHDNQHHDLDLHFVMDAQDILTLKTACERAIQKAQVLKDSLANVPWVTEVLSEDAET
jgi:hypothetical protein